MHPYSSEDLNVAELLATWLDREWQAKFLIDDQLHVLWQNRAGLLWLRDRHAPLKLANGRLVATDNGLQARLAASMVQSAAGGDTHGSTAVIKEPGAEHDWLFCVQHIGLIGRRGTFELSVRHLFPHSSYELVGLREAYQLTASENAILLQMVKGKTVDAIATSTGSSTETVRTHVRRAYSKLSVSSREEMFSRIRPFIFPRHVASRAN